MMNTMVNPGNRQNWYHNTHIYTWQLTHLG